MAPTRATVLGVRDQVSDQEKNEQPFSTLTTDERLRTRIRHFHVIAEPVSLKTVAITPVTAVHHREQHEVMVDAQIERGLSTTHIRTKNMGGENDEESFLYSEGPKIEHESRSPRGFRCAREIFNRIHDLPPAYWDRRVVEELLLFGCDEWSRDICMITDWVKGQDLTPDATVQEWLPHAVCRMFGVEAPLRGDPTDWAEYLRDEINQRSTDATAHVDVILAHYEDAIPDGLKKEMTAGVRKSVLDLLDDHLVFRVPDGLECTVDDIWGQDYLWSASPDGAMLYYRSLE
ncbi:hypothetical protein HIM_07486 [Hirsutella minnesotensis 3608]|uniref:Uncharacterized protein n=1 Tax=Hirsutella minnesotensis 3608 TaxID=1043627 RepID=A0A0F7ZYU9_9HYPO|nr:hypothetical protein HIM_07486 [Hirsutella minnesotensis 3608]